MKTVARTVVETPPSLRGGEGVSAENEAENGVGAGREAEPRCARRALVAFGGDSDLKWLRLLKPGYRHCFALLESGDHWVLYNPLSNGTEIEVWPGDREAAMCDWLVLNGYRVVEGVVQPLHPRPFLWAPYSCVEAVKRVLGLRAPRVFTPWQLYRHLKPLRYGKNSLTHRHY